MTVDVPQIFFVRQDRRGPTVDDPAARTAEALAALDLDSQTTRGQTVALGVGSRGIANLASIVTATVAHLKGLGLEPFVVPAMGSHGGANAAGQTEVLAGYGVTEAAVGCPVRAQMETVELWTAEPVPGQGKFAVHFDALAAAADHVVVVNRVKPHTVFEGSVESGLAKMLLIGLGKRTGAETYHRAIFDHEWPRIVEAVTPAVLDRVSVLAGVAIIENADDETARIEAIAGTDFLTREPELLSQAKELLPRLPFDELDIVLIDQIGKDISGAGWDTNTLGRKGSLHEAEPHQRPRVRSIVVRGLTPGTHGNAMGVGLAELCRTRVLDEMDRDATWMNALTSGDIPAGMAPIHFPTDRQLLDACATRTGLRTFTEARVCWIRNTLDLGVVACSTAFLDEARQRADLAVLGDPMPLPLDADGNLPDLLPLPEG